MMGRAGANSTIGAMHTGASFLGYAMVRAMNESVQRSAELRAEAEAHAIGQVYLLRSRRRKNAEALAEAAAKKQRLLADRRRLHG